MTEHPRRQRRPSTALMVVSLAAILGATLWPFPEAVQEPLPFWCLACGEAGVSHFLLNAALFVPLGAALRRPGRPAAPRATRSLVWGIAAGLVVSGIVEATQTIVPGRYPSFGDLLANAGGAGLGAALAASVPRLAACPPRPAALASAAAGAAAGAVFLGTGLLWAPSPTGEGYVVQHAPERRHLAHFRGEVVDARIGDLPLPVGYLSEQATRRARRLVRDGAPLRVTVRGAAPTPDQAPILRLLDDEERPVLRLSQDGTDLVLQVRSRADELGMSRPGLRLRGALPGESGSGAVRLGAWRPAPGPHTSGRGARDAETLDTYCLAAGDRVACGLGPPPGRGWALLRPLSRLGPAALRGLDGIWTALVFLPVGFWARWRWPTGAGIGLAAAGLLLAPTATVLVEPGFAEGAGAVAGLAGGILVSRGVRRHGRIPAPREPAVAGREQERGEG